MTLMIHHRTFSNPPDGIPSAPISVNSAADVLVVAPWRPFRVIRWGFLCTTTVNDANNPLLLTCDVRPTAGSNAGRIVGASTVVSSQTGWNASALVQFLKDAVGGSITMTKGTAQIAAGQLAYHVVAPQAPSATYSPYYPDPDTAFDSPGGIATGFVVYPGQEVIVAIQPVAPGSGAGKFFIEVEEQGFQASKSNLPQVAFAGPSSIQPYPSIPGTFIRFNS